MHLHKPNSTSKWLVAAIVALTLGPTAVGQPAGSLGQRPVAAYWVESSAFLAVRPTTPYANPTGCTSSSIAIVPSSHPAYKQLLATVMLAMESGRPLQLFAQGCYEAWGQTYPSFYAAGPHW